MQSSQDIYVQYCQLTKLYNNNMYHVVFVTELIIGIKWMTKNTHPDNEDNPGYSVKGKQYSFHKKKWTVYYSLHFKKGEVRKRANEPFGNCIDVDTLS